MPGAAVLNPHGRPKGNAIEQLRERYAGRLPEFFEGLFELTKSKNENMRLAAYREIFDRLIGKPQVTIDAAVAKFDVGAMYYGDDDNSNAGTPAIQQKFNKS